jgi:hypothetical protein
LSISLARNQLRQNSQKGFQAVPAEPSVLEKYISDHESAHKLKPDNEARILWFNDSLKEKTEYAGCLFARVFSQPGRRRPGAL